MKKIALFLVCFSSIAYGSGGGVAYLIPPSNILVAKDGSKQEIHISYPEFLRLQDDIENGKEVTIEGVGKFIPSEKILMGRLAGKIDGIKTTIVVRDEQD